MTTRVEGTLVLDGLIEGAVPRTDDGEALLRKWVQFAAASHLHFSVEFEGPSFSILPDDRPIPVERIGGDPARRIRETLQELLKIFPAGPPRGAVFSTLHSTEYRPHLEVQTLYVIQPDGTVDARQRTATARTVPPPRPLSLRQRLAMVAVGLVLAAALLGLSALFVDYGALLRGIDEGLHPFDADGTTVENGPFTAYFTVDRVRPVGGGRAALLTLRRTPAFPTCPETIDDLLRAGRQSESPRDLLAAEALAQGYVRVELFGAHGQFVGFSLHRIAALRTDETVELLVPLPSDRRVTRIVLTY